MARQRKTRITASHTTEGRSQNLDEKIGESKLLKQVAHTSACSYTLLSRFQGGKKKKANGSNYWLNILLLWTRSSWMGLKFPLHDPRSQRLQKQIAPQLHDCCSSALFIAPRAKWDIATLLQLFYFTSRLRYTGNDTLAQWTEVFSLQTHPFMKQHSLNTSSDHLFSFIFQESSQDIKKCRVRQFYLKFFITVWICQNHVDAKLNFK